VLAASVSGAAAPAVADAPFSSCPAGYVALTFDDGPVAGRTDAVLDVLAEWGAKGTFFVNGHRIDSYPETLQRIAAEGHVIANHTWGHENLVELSDQAIRRTILRAIASAEATGVEMAPLVRPPFGGTSQRVHFVIEELGMTEVLWTIDPFDWKGHSAATIASHVLSRISPGAIALFHDGSGSSHIAAALPAILRGMSERGYCPGLLDDAGKVVPAFDPASIAVDLGPECVGPDACEAMGYVGNGVWTFNDGASSEAATRSLVFGEPRDVPLFGDWDGDGTDAPGVYRAAATAVHLGPAMGGMGDVSFMIGNDGDVPLVGDWNGDGCDTVSVYRPATQTFFIFNHLGSDVGMPPAYRAFVFGNPGDRPFAGDFDGDGADEVGLHRPMTGRVYYRETLDGGMAHHDLIFGDPGDVVLAGDWNGDGADTLAAYRPGIGVWYIKLANATGTADHAIWFRNISGPTTPVVGVPTAG